MKRISRLAGSVGLAAAIFAAACDRQSPAPTTGSSGASGGATTRVASTAPTSQPTVLEIDGRRIEFPPVKLRLAKQENDVAALLYCGDQADRSIYLEMNLDISDPSDLPSALWRFRAASKDRLESLNGIFADEGKSQYQPIDVKVSFDGQMPGTIVSIEGEFVRFDTSDTVSAGTVVKIFGKFPVVGE